MRLFQVPEGSRVRITSKLIRWVEHSAEQQLEENVTWEGTVTRQRHFYKGHNRVLIIDHTIDWPEYGIWQKDREVEVIAPPPADYRYGKRNREGVLIDE